MIKIWNYLGEFSNSLDVYIVEFCNELLKRGVLIKLRRNRRLLQHPMQREIKFTARRWRWSR